MAKAKKLTEQEKLRLQADILDANAKVTALKEAQIVVCSAENPCGRRYHADRSKWKQAMAEARELRGLLRKAREAE